MTEASQTKAKNGGCLCGAVRYRVTGPLRQIVACHCGQCRRMTGNFVVATAVYRQDLAIEGRESITWYISTPDIRRGFCGSCGSHLFWDREASETISIFAGSLDQPSGLRVVEHIFVDDRADFTILNDGLPTRPQGGTTAEIDAD